MAGSSVLVSICLPNWRLDGGVSKIQLRGNKERPREVHEVSALRDPLPNAD